MCYTHSHTDTRVCVGIYCEVDGMCLQVHVLVCVL